jgi:hypothetical protein
MALSLMGAVLLAFASGALIAQPTGRSLIDHPLNVSPEERAAIGRLMDAQDRQDYASALALVPAARATARGQDARLVIASIVFGIGTTTRDRALQVRGLDDAITSGALTRETLLDWYWIQAWFAYDGGDFAKADRAIANLEALNPTEPWRIARLAGYHVDRHLPADGRFLYQRAIRLQEQAGQPVPLEWREQVRALDAYLAEPRPSPARSITHPNGSRVALVIGINEYSSLPRLSHPVADARAIADSLRSAGFEVDLVLDPDLLTMRRAVTRLTQRMQSAGPSAVGLFYFAGHGVQSSGTNYLVPASAVLTNEVQVRGETVSAGDVLLAMQESQSAVNIVILDACRTMPLARSTGTRVEGLAAMPPARGTWIAFSTSPNSVADDGSGAHSPFAAALINELQRPGQSLGDVFMHVRNSVLAATNDQQLTWDETSITGLFYFLPHQ